MRGTLLGKFLFSWSALAFLLLPLLFATRTPTAEASSVLQASNCQLELGKRNCSTTLTWGAAKTDLCLFVTSPATGVKQLVACPRSAATATATWIAEAGHRFDLQTGTSPDSPIVDSKFVKAEVAVLSGSSCQLNSGQSRCTSDVSVKITEGSSACLFIHDIASGSRKLSWCGTNGSQIKMPWVVETGINLELRQGMEVTSPLLAQLFLKGMRLTINGPTRGEARSAVPPRTLQVASAGLSASWDGRLLFVPVQVGKSQSGGVVYGMATQVFRPEVVQRIVGEQKLEFPTGVTNSFSPVHVFSCPPLRYLPGTVTTGFANAALCPTANVDKMDGVMHIAVAPDFRKGEHRAAGSNPYPSDCSTGKFQVDGKCETYKLVYLQSPYQVGEIKVDPTLSPEHLQARAFLEVVVQNPRSSQATIVSSKVEAPATVLRVRRDRLPEPSTPPFIEGEPIYGYETTMSLDGRLLIFQGHGSKTFGGILYYSFNPNPEDPNGWSQPRSVSEMHWVHGPGNITQGETQVETPSGKVLFSNLFPLAKKPIMDHEGKKFASGSFLPGAYPWLSFDSSELFLPSVSLSYAAHLRTGWSVVGALTNWRIRLIDGGMNTRRSTLPFMLPLSDADKVPYKDVTNPWALRWDFTLNKYSSESNKTWQTVLLSPLMLTSSMWDPQRSQWGKNARPMLSRDHLAIPLSPERRVYAFIESHSTRYFEVPLTEFEDGHYLVNLPMNEALTIDQEGTKESVKKGGRWDPGANRFNPTATQDVSGNGVQALLRGGAQFPFEDSLALNAWIQDRTTTKDIYNGVRGNSVLFPASGSVVTESISPLLNRIRGSQSFSLSLWIRPRSAAALELATVDNLIRILRDSDGKLRLTAWVNDSASELALPQAVLLPQDQWSHLGVRLESRKLDVFLNGKLASSVTVPSGRILDTVGADFVLKVGPGSRSEPRSVVPAEPSPDELWQCTKEGDIYKCNPRSLANLTRVVSAPSLPKVLQIDEVALSDVARSNDEMADAAFMLRLPAPAPPSLGNFSLPPELPAVWASVPNEAKLTQEAIDLGRLLFFYKRLSRNRSVSCASCHSPATAFSISQRLAPGIFQRNGERNPPTLLNRLFSKAQAWDGGAFSLEAQALMPIQNPLEMDNKIEDVLQFLRNDLSYDRIFRSVYGRAADADSLAGALAAFQRSLVSSNSRAENLAELSTSEKKGRSLFFGKARCAGCHAGPNLTDEGFHNIGLAPLNQNEIGRALVTGRAADVRKFKTPSLRNISQSAPYFHDGRFTSLRDVLQFYNRGGDLSEGKDFNMKPLGLDAEEMTDLEAFLRTLDGR